MRNLLKQGDRVYKILINRETDEERKKWGTVQTDEIEFWDWIDVKYDDDPYQSMFPTPIVCLNWNE